MKRHTMPFMLCCLSIFLLIILAACSEIATPGEPLVIITSSLEAAFEGEEYSLDIFSSGGVRPHTCKLDGTLPKGLRLDGCSLRGVPEETGNFSFSVLMQDANLSKVFKDYSLSVQPPPPAQVILDVPNTQLSGEFSLPIRVKKARALQGMRMLLVWEQRAFDFVALRQRRNDLIIFEDMQADGLHVDMAVLEGGLSGDALLFDLVLKAKASNTIQLEARTEFASVEGGHDYRTEIQGTTPTLSDESDKSDETGQEGDNPNGGTS